MMERSFLTDVLCPVIPMKINVMEEAKTKHHLTYKAYLKKAEPVISRDPSQAGDTVLGYREMQGSLVVSMLLS